MKRQLAHAGLTLALSLGFTVAANATILVSDLGLFGSPNDVVERQFTYTPATMGTQLIIQTYGWGGTANQPGGTNASGIVIPAGGFDPIIALYNGAIGGGGSLVATAPAVGANPQDNQTIPCGPGSGFADAGLCLDARIVWNNLPGGTYTLALTTAGNIPPALENGVYPGGGTFGTRTARYAVDVVAIPEPVTGILVGSGLLALGYALRRRART
jgi:hypothetical protein